MSNGMDADCDNWFHAVLYDNHQVAYLKRFSLR